MTTTQATRCWYYLHTLGGMRRCIREPDYHDGDHDYGEVGDRMFRDLSAAPCCGHLAHEGRCVGFANCGCDTTPTCDICDEPEGRAHDWNGDTGNHESCETRAGESYARNAVER